MEREVTADDSTLQLTVFGIGGDGRLANPQRIGRPGASVNGHLGPLAAATDTEARFQARDHHLAEGRERRGEW